MRRQTIVGLWLALVLLVAAVAVGAQATDAEVVGQQEAVATGAKEELTAQQAYERALVLLRSTLSHPVESNANTAAKTGSAEATRSGTKSNEGQQQIHISYRDILASWSPFNSLQRVWFYLSDYVRQLLGIGGSSNDNAGKGGKRKSSSSSKRKNKMWEASGSLQWDHGASYGKAKDGVEVEQARRWAKARPEQVWPEWDGGDDAFFGPFETTEWRTDAPATKKKRDKTAALKAAQEADQRRNEAIQLLTWASGWGIEESSIDWQQEASKIASRQDYQSYIDDFLALTSPSEPDAQPSSNQSSSVSDALWVLGTHSLWGTHGARPQPARAKACFQKLASLNGNATAHRMLGWLEGGAWGAEGWQLVGAEMPSTSSSVGSSAVDGSSSSDEDRQARALSHYRAAAEAGDAIAQSALAFRYHAGVGVPSSCGLALHWFQESARDAHDRFNAGPPGGLTLPYTHLRLSDMAGGAYGPGASAASTGHAKYSPAIHASLNSIPSDGGSSGSGDQPHRRLDDFLEFFTYHAERGSTGFALRLARIYYGGSVLGASESAGRVPRDYEKAREYALRITRQLWPTDSAVVRRGGPSSAADGSPAPVAQPGQRGHDLKLSNVDETVATHAGVAAGLIGRMWLRGEGVRQDYGRAWVWFSRGAEQSDAESFNGLGIMYRDGLGLERNVKKAAEFFEMAVGQGASITSAEACVNLGKFYYDMKEWHNAARYFELAIKLHNPFEAHHYLALIHSRLARMSGLADASTASPSLASSSDPSSVFERIGPPGTASYERCRSAVHMFKYAVERADWGDATFARAERAWHRGFKGMALMGWALAGERGFEAAQNNVAWVLDRDKQRLRLPAGLFGGYLGSGNTDREGQQNGAIAEEEKPTGRIWGAPPLLLLGARQSNATDRLALIHWTRSAAQDNVDAMVKMGDYYYYGLGLSSDASPAQSPSPPSSSSSSSSPPAKPSGLVPAYDKAAACYAAAADRQTSALAYWNMGWMYESGLGVPRQDFHLAKRYYDMAWETNPSEAYLPVMLSLIKLHVRALWATLRHGDSSALSLFSSYALLNSASLSGAAGVVAGTGHGGGAGGVFEGIVRGAAEGGIGGGGVGGAYTEQQEVAQRAAKAAEAAEKGKQAGRRKRGASDLADPNLPETYAAMGGSGEDDEQDEEGGEGWEHGMDDDEDDTIEGALIVFGLAALAALVYWRQAVQLRLDRMRRENAALLEQANRGAGRHIQQQMQQLDAEEAAEQENERRRREQPFGWPPGEGANHLAGL